MMMAQAQHNLDWRGIMAPGGAWSALVRTGSDPETVARHCGGVAYLAAPYAEQAQARRSWQINLSAMVSVMAARELLRLTSVRVSAVCPTVLRAEALHVAGTVDGAQVDPLDHAFWADWSIPFLIAARIVVVPAISGWQRCPMVARDVQWALDHNVPVHLYAGAVA